MKDRPGFFRAIQKLSKLQIENPWLTKMQYKKDFNPVGKPTTVYNTQPLYITSFANGVVFGKITQCFHVYFRILLTFPIAVTTFET